MANETSPIINIKNAEMPSTKISRLKKGRMCGTVHDNDFVMMTSTEKRIVRIEPSIEGMKIIGRANRPFLDTRPSNAPPRNNDMTIFCGKDRPTFFVPRRAHKSSSKHF